MKRTVIALCIIIIVGIQLIPVNRTNPEVAYDFDGPAEVKAILKRSCYDCHSNLTEWPWYSRVAPVSWLVSKDVKKGRDELNFSEWGEYSDRRRTRKLEEIEEKVADKEMPLKLYVRLHPGAALSVADAETLIEWSKVERQAMDKAPAE